MNTSLIKIIIAVEIRCSSPTNLSGTKISLKCLATLYTIIALTAFRIIQLVDCMYKGFMYWGSTWKPLDRSISNHTGWLLYVIVLHSKPWLCNKLFASLKPVHNSLHCIHSCHAVIRTSSLLPDHVTLYTSYRIW